VKDFDKSKMIIEPYLKGTTNCTILAVRFLKKYFSNQKNDENILFIHADHIFNDNKKIVETLKKAASLKQKSIMIGGRKPTYPGTKFGYVKTKKLPSGMQQVLSFVEKPDLKTAQKLYTQPNYY
jgi:mannose-1-phosphate guanylyltransferase